MPRLPVDGKKVSEMRITFGSKERELLQDLSTSYRIKSVLPSVAEILKDGTALYALGSAYEILTCNDLPFLVNPMEAGEFWEGLRNMRSQEERTEAAHSVVGGLGNLLDFFFATILNPTQINPGGD
jgi:hypothetical protein